jgi:hypothetical protein
VALAGRVTGAWGVDMGVNEGVVHFGAHLSSESSSPSGSGDLTGFLSGKLKHLSVWSLDAPLNARTTDVTGSRDDLSPASDEEGLLRAWPGVGGALSEALTELGGAETGSLGVELSEEDECVWRAYRCDDESVYSFPCPAQAQDSGAVDEDLDGLDDRAELSCALEDALDPASSDQNEDGVSDAEACLSLSPGTPMYELRAHVGSPLGVELWLTEPVEALRPQLLEVRLDVSDSLRLVGHETGEAALSAELNAFAAELQGQVRLTLTGYSPSRAAEGHLATVFFELSSEEGGAVSFDQDVWQVAPSYIAPQLTFGEGSASRPISLP